MSKFCQKFVSWAFINMSICKITWSSFSTVKLQNLTCLDKKYVLIRSAANWPSLPVSTHNFLVCCFWPNIYRISTNSFRGNYSFLEVRLQSLFEGGDYSTILLFVYNFIFRLWIMVANIIIKFIYFVAFLEYMNFRRLKLLKGALSWAPFGSCIPIPQFYSK